MQPRLLLALALIGCTPETDPVDPPIEELPPGVWEPVPGAWIWDASLAADNGTVWWSYIQRRSPAGEYLTADETWLAATDTTGTAVIAPSHVDPGSGSIYSPDVAVTPSAVVVATTGRSNVVRRYDHGGAPLGAAYAITVDDGGRAVTDLGAIELVATAGGGTQFVAALLWETAEVAIVDLDAAGTPTRTVLVGTPDATEPGGTTTNGVAAAARPDGSTIVAWDRNYNGCISTRPSATLTAAVDGATVSATQVVRDMPERGETLPAVAASGSTAYIAWQTGYANAPIALAAYPDVGTVLAELGDPTDDNREVSISLAAPGRGAIAWKAERAGTLNVVAFTETGGSVLFGSPHVVPAVRGGAPTSVGLVHVGDDRYVLGWIETRGFGDEERLYATELDLANEALRPAPPIETTVEPRTPTTRRARPCP